MQDERCTFTLCCRQPFWSQVCTAGPWGCPVLCSAPETRGDVPQQSQQPSSALFWDFPEFHQIFLQLQVSYLKKNKITNPALGSLQAVLLLPRGCFSPPALPRAASAPRARRHRGALMLSTPAGSFWEAAAGARLLQTPSDKKNPIFHPNMPPPSPSPAPPCSLSRGKPSKVEGKGGQEVSWQSFTTHLKGSWQLPSAPDATFYRVLHVSSSGPSPAFHPPCSNQHFQPRCQGEKQD